MGKIKVAVLVGSIRKNSYSGAVANCLMSLMPEDVEAHKVEIGHLPLYNQDYDANYPASYLAFKEEIKAADALLFVTPEHNRSFPAALKNALDIASRPGGESVWSGKPAAIVSQSISGLSGFGANHHLRQVTTVLNMPVMAQPECYLGNIASIVDEDGRITNEGTIGFLQSVVKSYVKWIQRFVK